MQCPASACSSAQYPLAYGAGPQMTTSNKLEKVGALTVSNRLEGSTGDVKAFNIAPFLLDTNRKMGPAKVALVLSRATKSARVSAESTH
jgi:hypothetical protein